MAEKNSANQIPQFRKSKQIKKDEGEKPQVETVPWQNQEICVVDNSDQCRNVVAKLRSYVKKKALEFVGFVVP